MYFLNFSSLLDHGFQFVFPNRRSLKFIDFRMGRSIEMSYKDVEDPLIKRNLLLKMRAFNFSISQGKLYGYEFDKHSLLLLKMVLL